MDVDIKYILRLPHRVFPSHCQRHPPQPEQMSGSIHCDIPNADAGLLQAMHPRSKLNGVSIRLTPIICSSGWIFCTEGKSW